MLYSVLKKKKEKKFAYGLGADEKNVKDPQKKKESGNPSTKFFLESYSTLFYTPLSEFSRYQKKIRDKKNCIQFIFFFLLLYSVLTKKREREIQKKKEFKKKIGIKSD